MARIEDELVSLGTLDHLSIAHIIFQRSRSIFTWWCGLVAAQRYLRSRIMKSSLLKQLSIGAAFLTLIAGWLIGSSANATAPASAAEQIRVIKSFDTDWRFLEADVAGG